MSQDTQAPAEKPRTMIEATLEGAWESVKAILSEDSERWEAAVLSPIAKSSEPARVAAARGIQHEQLASLMHAALEFQVRVQLAIKHRTISAQALGPLMQDLAGFAHAVANETKVNCRSVDCNWHGVATEAGPIGRCPTCDGAVFPEPPEKKLLGPTGEAIQA